MAFQKNKNRNKNKYESMKHELKAVRLLEMVRIHSDFLQHKRDLYCF